MDYVDIELIDVLWEEVFEEWVVALLLFYELADYLSHFFDYDYFEIQEELLKETKRLKNLQQPHNILNNQLILLRD